MIGANESPSTDDRNVAPAYAPIAPGTPSRATVRQCTFPKRQWLAPETMAVPTLAAWITADAAAAEAPAATRTEVPMTPKPMPSEPSINWATKPATTNTMSRSTLGLRPGRPPPGDPEDEVSY